MLDMGIEKSVHMHECGCQEIYVSDDCGGMIGISGPEAWEYCDVHRQKALKHRYEISRLKREIREAERKINELHEHISHPRKKLKEEFGDNFENQGENQGYTSQEEFDVASIKWACSVLKKLDEARIKNLTELIISDPKHLWSPKAVNIWNAWGVKNVYIESLEEETLKLTW